MTVLEIPELCLVALVGVSGSGKSTFAARHFLPTEVLSSDFCRGLVADDENDQSATSAAFDVLYYIAARRLEAGRLTVVDATNVQAGARRTAVGVAKANHVLAVAIVLDVPQAVCAARNAARLDRQFGPHVVRNQHDQLRRSIRGCDERASIASSTCRARRRSPRPRSSGSPCGTTVGATTAPSTSSATSMDASTSSPPSSTTSSTGVPPRRRCSAW